MNEIPLEEELQDLLHEIHMAMATSKKSLTKASNLKAWLKRMHATQNISDVDYGLLMIDVRKLNTRLHNDLKELQHKRSLTLYNLGRLGR